MMGFLNTVGGFPKLILSFFCPNLGTRNAKNPLGPFKVSKCNQKTAKLKKKFMSLNGFCGSREIGQKC